MAGTTGAFQKRTPAVACRRCIIIYAVVSGIVAFVLAAAIIPILIRISHGYGVYDTPGHRKLHTEPVPHLGGVGIVMATVAAMAAGYILMSREGAPVGFILWRDGLIIGGLLLVHVIGVIDDALDVPAFGKLALQFLPAGVIVAGGLLIEDIALYPGGPALELELGMASVPVTILWIVGVSTAVNLIDGLDGFAGGIVLLAAAAFAVLAITGGHMIVAMASVALAGATAGFLLYNAPSARIFMGDGGSLFAGAFLACVAVTVGGTAGAGPGGSIHILAAPLILAVPLLDIFAAVIRRMRRGVALHSADREHVHHLLLHRFGTAARVLAAGLPLAAAGGAAGVLLWLRPGPLTLTLAVATPVVLIAVYVRLDRRVRAGITAGSGRRVRLPAAAVHPAEHPAESVGAAAGDGNGRGKRKAQPAPTGDSAER